MAGLFGHSFLFKYLEPVSPEPQEELSVVMMHISDSTLPADVLVPALAAAIEGCTAAEQACACGCVVGAICSLLKLAPETTEPIIAQQCFESLLTLQLGPTLAEAVSCWLGNQPVFKRLQGRCLKFLTSLCCRAGKIFGLHFRNADRSVSMLPRSNLRQKWGDASGFKFCI